MGCYYIDCCNRKAPIIEIETFPFSPYEKHHLPTISWHMFYGNYLYSHLESKIMMLWIFEKLS
jgi:hypothetical protein